MDPIRGYQVILQEDKRGSMIRDNHVTKYIISGRVDFCSVLRHRRMP